ncbi:hypothetical protein BP6252_01542 [Coleophoma cylindrospora]|uniref:Uncharacterized protein n=1 Tax=Coleophoma cylindrospora TaxID=1849047 RepID=A0A3D8ST70_9HELO|nr:hypothetical protein BP6252_01542 [Coleophoma cylindrospora]
MHSPSRMRKVTSSRAEATDGQAHQETPLHQPLPHRKTVSEAFSHMTIRRAVHFNKDLLVRAAQWIIWKGRLNREPTAGETSAKPNVPVPATSIKLYQPKYQHKIVTQFAEKLNAALDKLDSSQAENDIGRPAHVSNITNWDVWVQNWYQLESNNRAKKR